MALANIACLLPGYLANTSQRVLVMDWDLEAPGLHRFFPSQSERPENQNRPGIIDYFSALQKRFENDGSLYEAVIAEDGWKLLDETLPLDEYLVSDVAIGGVDLIKAGKLDAEYADMVGAFNWISFYKQYGLAIDAFKTMLTSKYAYCLIDSRTGFTDVSGICTMLLPEKLIVVFTPNRQSLSGVLDLSTRATNYRRASSDFRPLAIFPLPSRIENAELALKRKWQDQYQAEFEEKFRAIYELEECELTDYFNEVQLPYIGFYAYGEELAVVKDRSESLSLRRAYELFFDRLMKLDFAWDTDAELERSAPVTQSVSIPPTEKKYDVFLNYVTDDLHYVEILARQLRDAGITLFFDPWNLRPGDNLINTFAEAMESSAAIAVCIGVLMDSEVISSVARQAMRYSKRVIPVYLPGASPEDAPVFLRGIAGVSFKNINDIHQGGALQRLIAGIKGVSVDEVERPAARRAGASRAFRRAAADAPEQVHFERVAQAIVDGRVIPFLGAGVNSSGRHQGETWQPKLDLPDFEELSVHLAKTFKYPDHDDVDNPVRDLARVAQYVSVTHGLGPLYEELHELFDRDGEPTPLHKFFASLPSILRQAGRASAYQLIVTTNYDDLLERAFKEAQEPFDLLSYVAEGEHRGKFLHIRPDHTSIVIEKPNEYQGLSLENRSVILKANGFVDRTPFEQDSFVITEDNFIDYLTRVSIRNIVPTVLTAKLRRSNYLMLGHSPGYWNLRVFLHLIWGEQKLTYNSWAVQVDPDEMDSRIWETRGVSLFNMRLDDYVGKLSERLSKQLEPGGVA